MSQRPYIPQGLTSVTPYLIVKDAQAQIDFICACLGATLEELHRDEAGERIRHAKLVFEDGAAIELGEASAPWGPQPCAIHLYVPDTDAAYSRALSAGASSTYAPSQMDYGERSAGIIDPQGNQWFLATFNA